jgi:nucleoside-diphosphate-sugar epimerase
MQIGITGATGFVGKAVLAALKAGGHRTVALLRHRPMNGLKADACRVVGPMEALREPERALQGLDVVVHLAARVHRNPGRDDAALHEAVNARGTAALAEAAARAGVRRFVFVSTLKVLGEESPSGPDGRPRAFTAADAPAPQDAYARAKAEGEARLHDIARRTGLEPVIVRPPLVYGPGVGGNFLSLIRLADSGMPLPFGAVRNRRSLVCVETLADLLRAAAEHDAAPGRALLVSDGEDLSTADLVRRLAEALHRPARLIPVPPALLAAGLTLLGRRAAYRRIAGSLFVDISETERRLGWSPPVPLNEALARTAAWYGSKYGFRKLDTSRDRVY